MSNVTYMTQEDALELVIDASESKVTRDITSNVTCGGIKPGDKVSAGDNLTDVIERILNEYQSPTITINLNPGKTLYEKGVDSLNTLQITAIVTKKSNSIKSIKYYLDSSELEELTDSIDNVANGGTFPFTYNGLISNDVVVKVVANDGKSDSVKTINIKFVYPIYTGYETGGLTKILKESKSKIEFNATCTLDKPQIKYPKSWGTPTKFYDTNGFSMMNSFVVTEETINGVDYYVYTNNSITTVTNFKYTMEF